MNRLVKYLVKGHFLRKMSSEYTHSRRMSLRGHYKVVGV